MPKIQTKRIYDNVSDDDGYRVLIDRLWPRGISKDVANINMWAKEIAPSSELRQWFNHDKTKFDEFTKKYKSELSKKKQQIDELLVEGEKFSKITLLYAAKDENCNHAKVLKDFIMRYKKSRTK
ncbi:DUF488 domain-containing protein [Planctomycetota bacterium]|nr:DUF488 domain-containing protein [Planctomycetota bacterium]